jgi:hypothetical protein
MPRKKKSHKEEDLSKEEWMEKYGWKFLQKVSDMNLEEKKKFFHKFGEDGLCHMTAVLWEVFLEKKPIMLKEEYESKKKLLMAHKHGIPHFCKNCGRDLWKSLEESSKLNNISVEDNVKSFRACGKCGSWIKDEEKLPRWAELIKEAFIEFHKSELNK